MYRFQFEYDFQDMLTLNLVHEKAHRRWWSRLLRVLGVVLGAAALGEAALLLIFTRENTRLALALALALAALGALMVTGGYWRPRLNAWQSKRMLVKDAGEQTVTLDGGGILSRDGKGESKLAWTAVEEAYHARGRYLLFVDRKHALILPERALTQGDAPSLRAFLEESLQREIKEV